MEAILIRRLEAKTVAAIDDLARKKRVSREQYVRDLIHNHAISVEVEGLHQGYQDIVQKVLFALEKNTDILTKFLIANGVTDDGD
ncbi:ribbon-helix-helix protein, CopG family [Listeria monocytogenes]|uniref:Ribbon-helix-helix protein, CopG family n=1 Tax=Listeria monocytogenes TaxID=1639 RepID=A0AAN2WEP2_LISMN|nr:ribbon-helix-helix protein, CopG family [Listeria monocytogenes]EAC3367760.1 ribbon-helix-helix protein, CopG family [Listeria monocytogenes]EAC7084988.1 ribbon-helix-helix protein, CopG family [Listeria monocytogenes]EAC8542015.1 ribbon-helix-helix protein, CopG family [Listeria monocytogenes]EAC8548016.1 ribbon-helix-helix protein, CopG family [Listeria monocytogenes]